MAAELTTTTLTVPDGTEDEVLQITGSSANSYRLAGLAITTGDTYTFSVWTKAAAATTVEFRVLGNLFTSNVTTAWQKVVFTVDEASTDYIDISPASDSALYLYKGMLQKGQFDTDWKPAPEDTESALAEVQEKASRKNTVYYSAAQPTGDLAEGDIWLNTSNGGIYLYDGASWVPHQVGTVSIQNGAIIADKIAVDTLAAICANLGDVTVGGVNGKDGSITFLDSDGRVLFRIQSSDGQFYVRNAQLGSFEINQDKLKLVCVDFDMNGGVLTGTFSSDGLCWDEFADEESYSDNTPSETTGLQRVYFSENMTEYYTMELNLGHGCKIGVDIDLYNMDADEDVFNMTLSCLSGNVVIPGTSIAFDTDSYGIKATSNTSTASSTGWLLRGHIVSNKFCCNLGNTSDDTRLYGANLYRSGTSTSISSDRRMKKDFTDLDQRYDSFYKALKPCQFRFLDNTSGRLHTGFIAQEVETALEEAGIDTKDFAGLVIDSLDEDALAEQGIDINSPEWADKRQYYLRYEEFIALNTCMIQKLQARVEELERCSLGLKISKIARQIRKGWLKMKKYITALALALCLLATTATAVFRAEPQTTKRVTYNEGISASEADYETYGNAVLEDTDSSVPDEEIEPEEPDAPDEPDPDVEEDDISNEEKIRTNLDPDSDVFYADVVCPGHIWEDGGLWDMEKPELGWFRFCLICGKTVSCDPPDDELDEPESMEDKDICETSGNAREE